MLPIVPLAPSFNGHSHFQFRSFNQTLWPDFLSLLILASFMWWKLTYIIMIAVISKISIPTKLPENSKIVPSIKKIIAMKKPT